MWVPFEGSVYSKKYSNNKETAFGFAMLTLQAPSTVTVIILILGCNLTLD